MNKNIIISIITTIAIICGLLYFTTRTSGAVPTVQSQKTEIRDGIQYVTILAKGGYSPKLSSIKPGIPTKLIVKTNGTFDCSASLVIRSIGFQKVLGPTQEELIDLGTLKSGDKIQGVCAMGMYSFQIITD